LANNNTTTPTGNLIDLQNKGGSKFSVDVNGAVTAASTYNTNTFTSSALTFGAAGTATIQPASGQALTINSGSASALTFDSGTTGSILIGTSTGSAKTIQIGPNATNTNTTTYQIGTNSAGAQSIAIGSTGTGATANANTTISIQGGTAANAISIGTTASVNQLLIGSTNTTSSTTLQAGSGGIVLGSISAANNVAYLCRNSSNQIASCNTTGTGATFVQGGNSFGAQAVLGTVDNNSLAFNTNNASRLVLDTSGNLQFQQASTINIASAATGTQLTVQGGAATSGTNVGGNLLLQGGAGASTGASGSVIVKSNANNSTTAFQVQQANTTALFTADTTNGQVAIGSGTPANGLLTIGTNTTTASGGLYFGTDTNLFRSAAGTLNLQGTGSTVTLQAAASSGTDISGTNLVLGAGIGTGAGSSGNINFQTAPPATTPNQSFITGANSPKSMAVDGTYIYWTNNGNNTIGRANLDGSSPNQSFITGANSPYNLTVDGTYIYWDNSGGNAIGRANLDGSSPNQSFITGANLPRGVAVNGSFIYWSNSGNNTIGRANLDGSSPNQSFITGTSGGRGVAINSSFIYWGNTGSTTIGRANLNGTSPNESYVTGATAPIGVAVNASYIYWSNTGTTIGRTALGSTTADTTATVASLSGSTGAALFQNTLNSTTAFQVQNAAASTVLDVDTTNGRVGIGTSAPGNLLSIGALTTADSLAQLAVSTGATTNKGIVVQAVASQSADLLDVESSTGTVLFGIGKTGHVISGGGVLPAATPQTADGTTGACTVAGDDTAGTVTITPGGTGIASGAICLVNFTTAFASAPRPVITATNAAGSAVQAYVSASATGSFTISFNATPSAQAYTFNWFSPQ